MTADQDHKIAVYHPHRIKRLTVIGSLESEFNCCEIKEWKDLEGSDAEIVIILFPELLIPKVSTEQMQELIEGLGASVILVQYDHTIRWIYGDRISFLINPSPEILKLKLRELGANILLKRSKGYDVKNL